jgi:hypothetical protein
MRALTGIYPHYPHYPHLHSHASLSCINLYLCP